MCVHVYFQTGLQGQDLRMRAPRAGVSLGAWWTWEGPLAGTEESACALVGLCLSFQELRT